MVEPQIQELANVVLGLTQQGSGTAAEISWHQGWSEGDAVEKLLKRTANFDWEQFSRLDISCGNAHEGCSPHGPRDAGDDVDCFT